MKKTTLVLVFFFLAAGLATAQKVIAPPQNKAGKEVRKRERPKPFPPMPKFDRANVRPAPQEITKAPNWRDTLVNILTHGNVHPNYYVTAGHRAQLKGVDEPENSMAVIKANRLELEMIEIDIKKSSDDSAYLMHDNYLQRTTDFLDKFSGTGTGSDPYGHYNTYTWAQVQTLTLKKTDGTYTSQKVPLFREVVRYVRDSTELLINVDIGDTAVFRTAWNIIKEENAFNICIFKSSQFSMDYYRSRFYNTLSAEQKEKVMFFAMITMHPVSGLNPYDEYFQWDQTGLAKGFEIGFKGNPSEYVLLDLVRAIRSKNRVRVHVFNTLPETYLGRYRGNVNIDQCCNPDYDARGDWQYLLDPQHEGTFDKGANGYFITDDSFTLNLFLHALGKKSFIN